MLRCTCPTPAGVHAARKGGCYGRRTFARKERLFLCRSQLQGCTGQAENQVDSHRLSNPWKQEEGGSVPDGAAPNLPASGGRYGGSGEGRTVCGLSGTLAENRKEHDCDYDVQLLRWDDEKHHRSVVPQNRRDHHGIDSPRHSGLLHSTAGAGKVQHGDSLSCPHSSGAEICGKDRPAFRESSG